jgi:hypothetical protein
MALRWPRDIERPLHLEVLALVVQHMALVARSRTRSLVAHKGIVFPAIPKAGHDIHELAGARVAAVGVQQVVVAVEVALASWSLPVVTTFQPARPPDKWSSEANLRAMVRLVERCRRGGHQPDAR